MTATREVPGLDRIRVDERLDRSIPTDITFRDHEGRTVRLADYFVAGKPVLLNFAYHSCTTLCTMVLDAVTRGISGVEWTAGDQYEIVTISIDTNDTPEQAATKRSGLLKRYGREAGAQGWHFLVGEADAIERITDAVGFRYFYDSRQESFAHPAVIVFLTPAAKVARYIYGIEFAPESIRMALLEASEGRSITTTEQFLMYCYAYDPAAGSYVLMATRIMKLGGLLTLLVLGGFLGTLWRRERHRPRVAS
ncbi:MAG: SCO family protein [Polyangiaceae bacterium]|nr:SCO family protein [Polyangiaceae bacterium]